MKLLVEKSTVSGSIHIPSSKSHTLRAVFIAAMAEGESVIVNPLRSLDCHSAVNSARAFGARCELNHPDGSWHITGVGGKPQVPENVIDCGNSGGTTYMTTALAAAVTGCTVVTGDAQIRRRPIKKLLCALNELGAEAFATRGDIDAAPVIIRGAAKGGICHFDGLLSSHITGVLLTAPLLEGDTRVEIADPHEIPYLEMTLAWLKRQGIEYTCNEEYSVIEVGGRQRYRSINHMIPGDWSSAAFPLVLALVSKSSLTLEGVDFRDTQGDKRIVDILLQMGARFEKDEINHRLHILPTENLTGNLTVNLSAIPDALPALAVAAACVQGTTIFTGIESVRLKETDRVAVMEQELRKMGVEVSSNADSMTITGGNLRGAELDSHGDHRVAMALAAAGVFAGGTSIDGAECIAVSYPQFLNDMQSAGAEFTCIEQGD